METLESIGQGESTTFVMPQELTSLVGRYGKHLTGSDTKIGEDQLDSLDFDEETRELLGLDDIAEMIGQIDEEADLDVEEMEQEAQAIKEGEDMGEIQDPDEVVGGMDDEFEDRDDDEWTEREENEAEVETETETE
jgi:hypothetical protein